MSITAWARWHEDRLSWAGRPALFGLLRLGTLLGPVRRVPWLGWVVTDPVLARGVLNDGAHFTLLGEGGVGHLWEQVLGDYVNRIFDGPGHADPRSRARDLFTDASRGVPVRAAGGGGAATAGSWGARPVLRVVADPAG